MFCERWRCSRHLCIATALVLAAIVPLVCVTRLQHLVDISSGRMRERLAIESISIDIATTESRFSSWYSDYSSGKSERWILIESRSVISTKYGTWSLGGVPIALNLMIETFDMHNVPDDVRIKIADEFMGHVANGSCPVLMIDQHVIALRNEDKVLIEIPY